MLMSETDGSVKALAATMGAVNIALEREKRRVGNGIP